MGVKNECAGHVCRCRCNVAAVEPQGVMLYSRSSVVTMKMGRHFERILGQRALHRVTGEGWPERLEEFYESLSPMERPTVRAVEIEAEGNVDPWQATDLGQLLRRMQSDWLPGVLNERRLRAYLQPILDLRTERVAAFEALMRVEQPDGRTRGAGEIIQAARAHNAMFQFDQHARQTAIEQGAPQLTGREKLFINFSPTVIYDPEICLANTWEVARARGIDPTRLVFEVVESEQFPRLDHLRAILDAYRERGAQVALDDLGAGYTAIRYIDELRPDIVKLDRDLLPQQEYEADIALLDGFVGYARSRGVKVVVEGIETETQYRIARRVGVDYGQGYFIGRPSATAERPAHFTEKLPA